MPVIELDYAELGIAWQRSGLPRLSAVFTWRGHASVLDDPQQALRTPRAGYVRGVLSSAEADWTTISAARHSDL